MALSGFSQGWGDGRARVWAVKLNFSFSCRCVLGTNSWIVCLCVSQKLESSYTFLNGLNFLRTFPHTVSSLSPALTSQQQGEEGKIAQELWDMENGPAPGVLWLCSFRHLVGTTLRTGWSGIGKGCQQAGKCFWTTPAHSPLDCYMEVYVKICGVWMLLSFGKNSEPANVACLKKHPPNHKTKANMQQQ